MTTSDGAEGNFVVALGAASIRPVPLLHSVQDANPALLRKRLHDLSNTLTGLLGNLELAGMAAEDGELDTESVLTALESARVAMHSMRELRQGFDNHFPQERHASHAAGN